MFKQTLTYITSLITLTLVAISTSTEVKAQSADASAGANDVAETDGQKPLNQVEGGVRVGHWRIEGRNGKTEEGEYVNGKKNGVWTTTTADGTVRSEVTFVMGVARGLTSYYYAGGTLMERGTWNVDHWEGDYERFYPDGGKSCHFSYNEKGQRQGHQTYYHENGNVMFDGNWADGRISGTLNIYDEQGRKVMERNYDASGKYQGSQNIEEPTATAANSKEFKGSGTFTIFDSAGRKERSGRFENGKLIDGEQYVYGENGALKTTIKVRGGKQVSSTPAKAAKTKK